MLYESDWKIFLKTYSLFIQGSHQSLFTNIVPFKVPKIRESTFRDNKNLKQIDYKLLTVYLLLFMSMKSDSIDYAYTWMKEVVVVNISWQDIYKDLYIFIEHLLH